MSQKWAWMKKQFVLIENGTDHCMYFIYAFFGAVIFIQGNLPSCALWLHKTHTQVQSRAKFPQMASWANDSVCMLYSKFDNCSFITEFFATNVKLASKCRHSCYWIPMVNTVIQLGLDLSPVSMIVRPSQE